MVQVSDAPQPQQLLPSSREEDDESARGRTILLVDDEPIVLETAKRVVTALGHDAVALSSPDAAVRWFAEHADKCALVITDYRMRERTGTQMVAALRAHRSNLPAVVVSGFAAEELIAEMGSAFLCADLAGQKRAGGIGQRAANRHQRPPDR